MLRCAALCVALDQWRHKVERGHVSQQVQTEVGKNKKEETPSSTQTDNDEPETKAWGVQEDMHRERRTEPMQLYPQ